MVPPALDTAQQSELKAAIQEPPAASGIRFSNWTWKVVRTFVQEHFGRLLGRSACFDYLHRLGFVVKRPKKRLLKADTAEREAFVARYAALRAEAQATGARIVSVDEARFHADAELRAKWVLRGQPALVDSTCPSFGEKASYYSGVCLETGTVDAMGLTESCTAETSVVFLQQLRAKYREPLIVIWDNSPAHRGPAMRDYLSTDGLNLRLVPLPAYSPDFNPDEAIWDWVREEETANTCFDTAARVCEHLDRFFAELANRTAEVKQRCRSALQALADGLAPTTNHVDPMPDSV